MNSVPMPDEFWLYQTIPAAKLTPGQYRIACKLWVEVNKKTNCRLFANQNVQYYGYESDYTNLLTPGENVTYAGYAGGSTNDFVLRDMEVYVTVAEGEDLTIGIKTGNKRNNGVRSTSDNAGWFKVDFFRIHKMSDGGQTTSIDAPRSPIKGYGGETAIYNLQGSKVHESLKRGVYIVNGRKFVK